MAKDENEKNEPPIITSIKRYNRFLDAEILKYEILKAFLAEINQENKLQIEEDFEPLINHFQD